MAGFESRRATARGARLVPVLVIALAAFAAPAQAQPGCDDPGGDAALNAYCEELPGPSGDKGNAQGAAGSLDRRIDQAESGRTAGDPSPPAEREPAGKDSSKAAGGLGSAIESGGEDKTGFILLIGALAAGTAGVIWLLRRRSSART